MLLADLNFEVGQCPHELFVVRTDSITSRIAIPPSFISVLCDLAEGVQYSFKMMLIFQPNMLLDEGKAY